MSRLATVLALSTGLAWLATSCSCSDDSAPTAPSGPLPYLFTDVTTPSGLAAFTQVNGTPDKEFVVESFGAGVALFDAEGDGDMDAYLANAGKLEGLARKDWPPDALFLNDGKAKFTDGTAAAGLGDRGWTNGVRTVDLDSDGDVELYLTNYGPNVMYDNVGGGKFVDVTERTGLGLSEWSAASGFFDFDKDGDLDVFVAEYLRFDEAEMLRERPRAAMQGHEDFKDIKVMKGPMGLEPLPSRFFRNEGGAFKDVSREVGIADLPRFGFQVLTFDFDLDGWLDVFVVNDVLEDSLWRNDGGKRFVEASLQAGVAVRQDGVPQGGMGGAVGDFDGDLLTDLFVANFVEDYSTLFRGQKGGFYSDVTQKMGLRKDTWLMVGWACGFVDFDSDGDQELFQINGHTFPQVDLVPIGTSYKQKNQLWELAGGRYVIPPGAGGPGFDAARAGRSAAIGDVDGDGDQDMLIGNLDDHPTLLRNDTKNQNWLLVRLVGTPANGGRDAIGARMVLRVGERQLLRLVGAGSGFLNSNDPREHFGLGAATKADELTVTWFDGRVERFPGLAAGQLHVIEDQGGSSPSKLSSQGLGK